jgi:hypothetical protein
MADSSLVSIADGLWQVTAPDLKMPGGARLPVRSTLVRLPDRTLALYSPVKLADETAAEITALGEVAHLIGPNRFHHLFLGHAMKRWPKATVHGAPGLAAKRKDLTFHRELGRDAEPAWRDALAVEVVDGAPRMNETVLLHRPTGTLIVCDLVFNVGAPANFMTKVALACMGVGRGGMQQSRAWRLFRNDKGKARASIDRVLGWPITSVAFCHGEPYREADARVRLAGCMSRICDGAVALPAGTAG